MSAAKLLREGAARALSDGDDDALGYAALTGADALDALAVPGVTLAIRALANNPSVILSGSGNTMELDPAVRAALSRLAKIASEGK